MQLINAKQQQKKKRRKYAIRKQCRFFCNFFKISDLPAETVLQVAYGKVQVYSTRRLKNADYIVQNCYRIPVQDLCCPRGE